MLSRLARWPAQFPWIVLFAWIAAGVGLTLAAPRWDARAVDDDVSFLPERFDSVRGQRLLGEAFPREVCASRAVLVVERPDRPLSADDFQRIDQAVAAVERLKQEQPGLGIGRLHSHRDPFLGPRLVSADGHCSLIQVSLDSPFLAARTREAVDAVEARAGAALAGADSPRLLVTGPAGVGRDLVRASIRGLDATTVATVVLVVIVLLAVYRAPLLALVPLVTVGAAVWVALQLLALATLLPGVYLVNVSQVFAVVLLYGAGTDYCLFLISRYREELARGRSVAEAVRTGTRRVAVPLAASASTVILGLGLMACAEFAKVRCAGPAIALALAVALAASLTLTPALLRLLGRAAFWPGRPPEPAPARRRVPGFWDRAARLVTARPAGVFVAAVLLLLPLALWGLGLRANYNPTAELPPRSPSVQGLQVLQERFTAGETGPITVLLTAPAPWDSPAGRAALDRVSRRLAALPNVAEVRSLTQPLGSPLAVLPGTPAKSPGPGLLGALARSLRQGADTVREAMERPAREFYLADLPGDPPRHVARLDVVPHSAPFTPESFATLEAVQAWLRVELPAAADAADAADAGGPVAWDCHGPTVSARDLAALAASDRGRVNLLVLAGIFLVLVLLVRRIALAAYLLATVLFSYLAALGATSLAGFFWQGRPLTEVDWRVPFFLFTLLVAVGEDYNIFLLSRALEERRKRGTDRGLRRALGRTGGTITSCGLIMAGTFGTLMLGGLGTLVQCGFALAFGVLLDTFVVRPFLVPAFTLMLWRYEDGKQAEQARGTPTAARGPRPERSRGRERQEVPQEVPRREAQQRRKPGGGPLARAAARLLASVFV